MNNLSILYTPDSGTGCILLNCAQLRNIAVVCESKGASVHWVLVGRHIGSERHARIAKFINHEEASAALIHIVDKLKSSNGLPVVFDATRYRIQVQNGGV